MDVLIDIASSVRSYFSSFPEIKDCIIYGSVANGGFDEYSDVDVEIDVSGCDNSLYALKIPGLLDRLYPVVFFDYAPSLK